MREKEIEMRPAKPEDLEELKILWKLCFGDEDRFIDYSFQSRDWLSETAVLIRGEKIASMLTMIPVWMVGTNGEKLEASMLFAIATHPDDQKRGFADQLIEYSNQYLHTKHINITLLVPAGEALFRFYGKRGYRDGFFVREAVLSQSDIQKLSDTKRTIRAARQDIGSADCRITSADPSEYNRLRRKQLQNREYLDYRDSEVAYQKNLIKMFDADLLAIQIGNVEGCAYYERISQAEVMIKELLIPDQYLAAVLQKMIELVPCEKFVIRTPAWSGALLGGSVRSFGMIRVNEPHKAAALQETYLGFAYD